MRKDAYSDIVGAAGRRSRRLTAINSQRVLGLEPKYLLQMVHLTTPATVWRYVEKAVTRSEANLVLLDLEDSIPRDNAVLLQEGWSNVVRAFKSLDWGSRLRFFRPRGLELDPGHEDLVAIISEAGGHLDGLIYPKIQSAEELISIDHTLGDLESRLGLPGGGIRIETIIESALAVERVFEIAACTRRLVGLVFGSYDYWASLGQNSANYRSDHPLLGYARSRIVQAAASVGVPAIAEMTTNYPTSDKSEEQRRLAVEEFRRDATLALDYGFSGKWTGIPEQSRLAAEIFRISDQQIDRAVAEARLFLESERLGRGATMIDGKMADRATDRLNLNTLKLAFAAGRLDKGLALELLGYEPDSE
jgi:citrate lyase subunit beta/citryl-CoA lyase